MTDLHIFYLIVGLLFGPYIVVSIWEKITRKNANYKKYDGNVSPFDKSKG